MKKIIVSVVAASVALISLASLPAVAGSGTGPGQNLSNAGGTKNTTPIGQRFTGSSVPGIASFNPETVSKIQSLRQRLGQFKAQAATETPIETIPVQADPDVPFSQPRKPGKTKIRGRG